MKSANYLAIAILATIALMQSADAAAPKPLPRFGVFVFSNVCWEPISGDAAGHRMTLMRYSDGDQLTFEWSEGGLEGGSANNIDIDAKTSQIYFEIVTSTRSGADKPDIAAYSGTISDDHVTLQMLWAMPEQNLSNKIIDIPRVRNFNGKTATCKFTR